MQLANLTLPCELKIFQFWREISFFGNIALFAAGHNIPFGRATSPGQGNDMIHGELLKTNFSTTVMAGS